MSVSRARSVPAMLAGTCAGSPCRQLTASSFHMTPRRSAEFRVWHEGDDMYYLMYEKVGGHTGCMRVAVGQACRGRCRSQGPRSCAEPARRSAPTTVGPRRTLALASRGKSAWRPSPWPHSC